MFCLLAIAGVMTLQFFWIRNYYNTSLYNFEREVNLIFEDAIKKDFQVRNDTIEHQLTEQLMDTSAFIISTKKPNFEGKVVLRIINKSDTSDYTAFSHSKLNQPLTPGDTAYKRKIARHFANNLRSEDLENHVVYYRTQNLGRFTLDKLKDYGFDTTRLRTIFNKQLAQRNINTAFYFRVSDTDSLLNYEDLPDTLFKKNHIVTKAFPTYKWWAPKEQYVSAVFKNPFSYVMGQMKWILAGSLFLIILVAVSLLLLLKALFHEKKLTAIKNDFINNITHELKTPVATIAAALEAMQEGKIDMEKQIRYTGYAQNETQRLTGMIESILHTSLFEEHKIKVDPEPIDFEKTIREIMETLQMRSNKIIHFKIINTATPKIIKADKPLFWQAMNNILDNAVKYSGEEADIKIICESDNSYLHITCNDKGEGIAPSAMPFIFEKFYRQPRQGHSIKGYGLGLHLVQKIMNLHRGKIQYNSNPHTGTTFILSWPL